MDKFTTLTGVAAPLKIVNVDTDMIIPKDYLKTIKRTGLGKGLFSEQRYKDDGSENPDFVLNQDPWRGASILLTRENFGCGSSREHAVWALENFGFRAVIAPSFADIFYNNCFKNGVLPIVLAHDEVDALFEAANNPAGLTLRIDLNEQQISQADGPSYGFAVDAHRRASMLEGLDHIGETLKQAEAIRAFEAERKHQKPWLFREL